MALKAARLVAWRVLVVVLCSPVFLALLLADPMPMFSAREPGGSRRFGRLIVGPNARAFRKAARRSGVESGLFGFRFRLGDTEPVLVGENQWVYGPIAVERVWRRLFWSVTLLALPTGRSALLTCRHRPWLATT